MTTPAAIKTSRGIVLRKAQRGVVLFISLIVLVAMTLAGIAMMRSVDTNVLIAGNLAFRSAAMSAADAGLESARVWLTTQPSGALTNDQIPGYFANWQDSFNPGAFDWANQALLVGNDGNGNEIRYIVHRMCAESAKTVDGTDCFKMVSATSGSSQQGGSYGITPLSGTAQPYFRITTRVVGPRNTVSYVQAFVY
jgi:type IV pilus assembly protein PilX